MYAQCDSQLLENNDGLMVRHEFVIKLFVRSSPMRFFRKQFPTKPEMCADINVMAQRLICLQLDLFDVSISDVAEN